MVNSHICLVQNTFCFIILTDLFPLLFTFYIFIQQIQVLNILNIVYTLLCFFKFSWFLNSNTLHNIINHILYIYSTNICTEYFKQGMYSLFSLQNAVSFIFLKYLFHVLFTFYRFIQQI